MATQRSPAASRAAPAAKARHVPEQAPWHLRDPRSRGAAALPPTFFDDFTDVFGSGAVGSGQRTQAVAGGEIRPEPKERTEVTVKNTFIHVEDVPARTPQRCRSESDLSSGSGSGSFWSHNDTTSNSNASSVQSVPDIRSTQARLNAKSGASNVADSRPGNIVASIAARLASAEPPPSTTLRSTLKTFDPAPGSSRFALAASVPSAQFHTPIASPSHIEGQYDLPGKASEEEDLGDVPNEGGDAHPTMPIQWSVGSEEHAAGTCRPCIYIRRSSGCRNGHECSFCHVPHKVKSRVRPCKQKRLLCKQMVERYDSLRTENSQMADALRVEMDAQIGSSAPEGDYMLRVIAGKAESRENYREWSEQSTGSTTLQQHARHQPDRLWKMRL